MKILNQVKFELENFEKLHLMCAHDCTIGMIYDYAVALHAFAVQKVNEINASLPKPDAAPPADAPAEESKPEEVSV